MSLDRQAFFIHASPSTHMSDSPQNQVIKVAVIGASGYTGEELLRLLSWHPKAKVTAMTSRQYAGQSASQVLGGVFGTDLPLFTNSSIEQVADMAEVFFLALPHGVSASFAKPLYEMGKTVIDLSADFRLNDPQVYEQTYGKAHEAPELLDESAYALVEWNREEIIQKRLLACPGCYPTSIQLPLIPLLKAGAILPDSIQATSLSGISGAGKKESLTYSFSERYDSLMAYGVPGHRHRPEMEQELSKHASQSVQIRFVPHLVPLKRGMHSTIGFRSDFSLDELYQILLEAYQSEPFVSLLSLEGVLPDSAKVSGSNHCQIAIRPDPQEGYFWLFSVIDNLGKGAASQAIQAFNVHYQFPEMIGLAR
ncbi:MAG: N-acetyl-gamma-glutamyl-phosphate reductase [Verrucomicrobiota bacterium]